MKERLKKIEKRSYHTDDKINRPSVSANNFSVRIISNQKQHLKNAVNMLFDGAVYIVEQYKITDDKLILSGKSYDEKDFINLPFPMNEDMTVEFIWNWLSTVAVYKNEPDHDGDNSIAFCIHNHDMNYDGKGLSIWNSNQIIVETGFLMHAK